jgi:hypothetical protein
MCRRFYLVLLLFFLVASVYSQQNIADKTISVNYGNKPLKKVIKELHDNSGILFTYSEDMLPINSLISLSGQHKLSVILDKICIQSGIQYTIIDNQVVLHKKNTANTAKKHTIKGFVTDSLTNETLIGASIFFQQLKTGQLSNVYGFYSATLPEGTYRVQVNYVGYKPLYFDVKIDSNITKDFKLIPSVISLKEIIVKDSINNVRSAYLGSERLNLSEIGNIPVMFGEQDIIGLLMSKAGVQNINEGASGLHVRGGSVQDNVFQLDEAPLFNINHLGGIASVFNSDALKTVNIYKGAFPVEYGGGLSSIVDVRMKEGNQSRYVVKGGIGLISSRLMIEGPIKKDRSSFLISARRSYIGDLIKVFTKEEILPLKNLYFSDINAKANITLNNRNRLFLSGYFGKDILEEADFLSWGNVLGVARWNHVFNEKTFINTTFIRSHYSFDLKTMPGYAAFAWKSTIDSYTGKLDIDFYSGYSIKHGFGAAINYLKFAPITMTPFSDESIITPLELEPEQTILYNLYYQATKQVFDKLKVNIGSRFNIYQKLGPGSKYVYDGNNYTTDNVIDTIKYSSNKIIYNYFNLEPRINITYMIDSSSSSIKAAYSRTTKFIHSFRLNNFVLTFDRLVSSSEYVPPSLNDIYSIGYFKILNRSIDGSAEIFYKNIKGINELLYDYKMLTKNNTESLISKGNGYVYGIELSVNGKVGRFAGYLNYSWSRVMNKIKGINNNKPFPPYYDRGQDMNCNIQYKISKRITLSANNVILGGRYINMPVGQYTVDNKIVPQYDYNKLNLEKLKPYYRVDMAVIISGKPRPLRKWKGTLEICVYNLYSKNKYIGLTYRNVLNNDIDLSQKDAGSINNQKLKPFGISFSTIIPSVSYNFTF